MFWLALFALPCSAMGQPQGNFTIDRAKIVECVDSQGSTLTTTEVTAAAKNCTGLQMRPCFEFLSADRPFAVATATCYRLELTVWQQLLKEAYNTDVAMLQEHDGGTASNLSPLLRLAPTFIEAHQAWEKSAELDCQLRRRATGNGSARMYAYEGCAVLMTAARMFYYRHLGLFH